MMIVAYMILGVLFLATIDLLLFPNEIQPRKPRKVTKWERLATEVKFEEWERTARAKALENANARYRKALGLSEKY